jgi:glucose/arabinose dehydrogenase
VNLERAFPGVDLERMTGLYQAPDGRWFVTQQIGRIFLAEDRGGAQPQVFLDLTSRVSTAGSEEGLLGFAFAPDFAGSGQFYVYYSAASGARRTVVSRFTAAPGANAAAILATENVLLEIPQPFSNHKGGQIAFGPDGYLYVGLGDGGSARDPMGNGQNLGALLAKILRIDVSGGGAYRIPLDNPFVGRAGARGEVWAYGVRNPWRFSFDSATGRLWLADVGQDRREEVNVVEKGGNYGWNVLEGSECLGGGTACARDDKILPILEYETGANCSITGGFVYHGSQIASLQGAYVYGDYCSGRVWGLRYDGSRVRQQAQLTDSSFRISSFAVDNSGEIYVIAHGESASQSGIFKLVP